jgi:predicted PurR-regulated permease PerM
LNWWLRVLLFIIATTVVVIIAWNAIGAVGHIVFIFFASLLFAYLIGPIVDRWSRRMRRGAATGLVFLIVLPLAAFLLFLFISPIIGELRQVATSIASPSAAQEAALTRLSTFLADNGIPIDVNSLIAQLAGLIKGASETILNILLGAAGGLVSFITDLLMILAITFFLSVDGRGLNVRVLRLMTDSFREHVLFVEATISGVIGGYIRAQVLIATLYGLLAGGGSWLLGLNYALFIGIAAFFLEFIPLVGPVISMGIAIVVSLFQPFPLVVFVALYFIFIQQLESNVLEPRIGGRILGLHAVVVIVSVLAGAALGGILGAFLALPVVAAFTTLGTALYLDIRGRTNLLLSLHPGQSAEGPPSPISETPALMGKQEDGIESDHGDGLVSASQPAASAQATAVVVADNGNSSPDSTDIMKGAPPAALMFKDRLDYVLKEQARLKASYEEIAARQSAAERRAHGLA